MENTIKLELKIVDRALILQKIIDGSLSQIEASDPLGLTTRQVRRLLQRFKAHGAAGLTRHPGSGRQPKTHTEKSTVLQLIKQHYADFGPTFAAEKLAENHQITISRETVRQWMHTAGIWHSKKARQAKIHQSRTRRARFGELIQVDGSPHAWFEDRAASCCLLVMVDDATSQITAMRFEPSETTFGYMRCAAQHIEKYGRPLAFYSDKHSIFRTTRTQANAASMEKTQLHRALQELGIELICAHSPQAKGRVERANSTLQDRLVKDMRLAGISSLEAGNAFIPGFITRYNDRFARLAADTNDAHRPMPTGLSLELILSKKHQRKVTKNLEFSLEGRLYKLRGVGSGHRLRQAVITIYELPDGKVKVFFEGKSLDYEVHTTSLPKIATDKQINALVDRLVAHDAGMVLPTSPTAPAQLCA
jgi:transposase